MYAPRTRYIHIAESHTREEGILNRDKVPSHTLSVLEIAHVVTDAIFSLAYRLLLHCQPASTLPSPKSLSSVQLGHSFFLHHV